MNRKLNSLFKYSNHKLKEPKEHLKTTFLLFLLSTFIGAEIILLIPKMTISCSLNLREMSAANTLV